MRRGRVASVLLVASGLAVAGAFAPACGGDEGGGDAARPDAAALDAGVDLARVDAALPAPDAGVLAFVDEPDTACTPAGGATRELFAAADGEPATPLALATLGERRAALLGYGFTSFAADGAGPTPLTGAPELAALSAGASSFAALRSGRGQLVLQRFSPEGTSLGASSVFESQPSGYGLGPLPGGWVAVWSNGSGLVSAAVAREDGSVSPPFFVRGLEESDDFHASVAPSGGADVGVAMSGGSEGTGFRISFARLGEQGLAARSFTLAEGAARLRVLQLARLPAGWALLFGVEGTTNLALLDDAGRYAAPVRRLLGTTKGYGLAVAGERIGVVALHREASGQGADAGDVDASPGARADAVAFRAFGLDGAPATPWRCFDAADPADADTGAAIARDGASGTGFAVVRWTPARSVALTRLDAGGD